MASSCDIVSDIMAVVMPSSRTFSNIDTLQYDGEKNEYNCRAITRDLLELEVIPVKFTNGIAMIRTESDYAENASVKLRKEYPKLVEKNIPDIQHV